jgi:hypothetical protein
MAPHGRQFSIDRLNSTNPIGAVSVKISTIFFADPPAPAGSRPLLAGVKTVKWDALAPLATSELCARLMRQGHF